jgi:hypothetical protein
MLLQVRDGVVFCANERLFEVRTEGASGVLAQASRLRSQSHAHCLRQAAPRAAIYYCRGEPSPVSVISQLRLLTATHTAAVRKGNQPRVVCRTLAL